jgi:hypothetical protein
MLKTKGNLRKKILKIHKRKEQQEPPPFTNRSLFRSNPNIGSKTLRTTLSPPDDPLSSPQSSSPIK